LLGLFMSGLKPNVYLGVSVSASMLFSGLYVPGAAFEKKKREFI
jgi:hypothetical protein